eukprot:TRINITY_DN38849_c0_g1_i1.p2 TRINITY_DN38849_c0_g1~~TRINITY_DN38849_c0_g1_i1.p2  ORF type:complete len:151 (-),score=1.14 TRINITY_DN38849_c0_g1_i1:57-509(-)
MTKKHKDLSGSEVIVCEQVDDYRKAIGTYVTQEDIVLELGCAEGVTTNLIGQHCQKVVGLDKSLFQYQRAQERFPLVRFENIDAFDISSVLALGYKFNKIFIDVSGSRDISDLINLIESYEKVFQPDLFVVKSYKLKKLVQSCIVFPVQR